MYMNTMLYWIKRIIPQVLLQKLRPPYHLALSYLGSVIYKHPSREIMVIGVTGTKGKSSVTELITAILEADGKKVASLSTIQFKIGDTVTRNLFKMTLPGRFFVQKFLREAVDAKCTHAVIEMTSEGARQFRHRFVEMDALVFTNLSPEHIESHGSFQKYKEAKLSIAKQLEISAKQPRYIVANTDDEHGRDFLRVKVDEKLPYGLSSLKLYTLHKDGIGLIFKDGDEEVTIRVPLVGLFNVYNTLAAITMTRALGVSLTTIEMALRSLKPIAGRVEHFFSPKSAQKQVTAIVDYAHTPDSLEQLYKAFKDQSKVCVLGNTGGGRDTWKRPEMAQIAERYCEHIILTNEDPYDEDPRKIVDEMAKGITDHSKLDIIMDRRMAIAEALQKAKQGGYVLISGKGTDPYIMGARNNKQVWSDAQVVQEELGKLTERREDHAHGALLSSYNDFPLTP
jgi:UDP-N-acetylmuramoyl-L-alanyl-D-glutamate--2,6-diaminopimelate ligase